jgi:hypothetical protein
MILADFQIRALCEAGMVAPFDPALVNPASLDLRLGSNILIESSEGPGLVPYCMAHHTADDPYRMVPGQFLLAEGGPSSTCLSASPLSLSSSPPAPPSARKDDASPSRPFQPTGGLMEPINASLQRGRQG